MKRFKKTILSSAILLVLFLMNVAPILADLRVEPSMRSPFLPRGMYSTDLFTGTASYSYPIKVPKGTDDLTPNVSLSYNSSSTFAPSAYSGMGWDLNRDYVERDVNFTAGSTGDDKFRLFFQGQSHELVYVSADGRWHTKIESNLHISRFTTGASNDYGEYWQVVTPDGTRYRFGQASNSEQVCNGRSYVYRWNLDLVTDMHDNKIYYTYNESDGASYLSQIKYNNDQSRIIDFTYGTNPYQREVYIQGCKIKETSRLSDIKVKINTSLVHQFDLGYATASNSGQLLQSITEKGSNGSELPATRFDYKPEIKSWALTSEIWLNNNGIDAPLNSNNAMLIDVNGDSLPDLVKSEGNGSNTWKVLKNTGTSLNPTAEIWINNAGVDAKLEMSSVTLMDVTGDNLPDIVKADSSSSWKILRNTGSSWNTSWEQWGNVSTYSGARLGGTGNDSAVLADVNGDGLPDIVNSWWNAAMEYRVFKNTGTGWSGSPEVWSYNGVGQGLDNTGIRLMDVNGDGLPDIVRTTNSGTNSTWYVYKNTGSSWNTSAETWINNANIEAYFGRDDTAVADANGDGLVDIIKGNEYQKNGNEYWDIWKVFLNTGNSWSTTYETWVDDKDIDVRGANNVRLADVTGDGMPDIIRGQSNCSCSEVTYYVWKNNGKSPHLLQTIYTSDGGNTKFDYIPSGTFDNTGPDSLSDLPFPLWLVEKMTVNNGMTNSHQTNDITTYSYKDGLYDWQDREFRGFADVNTTEPNGSKKKYVFKQDDALKGRMDEMQHRNLSSDPYVETDNTWSSSTTNGVTTVKLDTEKFITYDATTSGAKTIQNDYLYDSYGNVTKKSEKGDISISTDDRFIYNEYSVNTTSWIVNTPKHTYLHKSDDTTKVSESWFYYDGNALYDSAPVKGDLTKEEKWLSGGNKNTTYAYDTYGNQTSVTDANNHTTTTAYDTTNHTYPISQTNAKSQTTTMSYELGTGNLLSKTDPNGFTTSYTYDVFGRITKEIKPYDSATYPTTLYQYFNDGVAPEGLLVSKRETSSSSATLDTYTILDGLGRKIQTRMDAEDSSKQRVTDVFYDPTGEIKKETVPYLASSSAVIITPTPTPPPASKFGDGSDGDITISSNTTESPIDSSVTATSGTTTATVGSGLGFATNQIVLFHQTQGTNAGAWEYARVQSYSGTTLTVTTALTNSYSSSGNNKAQVRVVRQYNNVTVNSGVTWTAKAWNGTTGGILVFLANGTVNISGTISASQKGFVGSGDNANTGDGLQGEGTSGAGTNSTSANGSGGGGGHSDGNGWEAGGGAGGGHSAAGSNGANGVGGTNSPGGTGGSSTGNTALTTMTFGGAGAQGGRFHPNSSSRGGAGGSGGGIVTIIGKTVSVSGAITSGGANGGNASGPGASGGGGGGAGGSILLKGENVTLGSALVTAGAGSGGTKTESGGNGGAGTTGRIRVEYEASVTGSTSPTASIVQNEIFALSSGTSTIVTNATYGTPDNTAKYTEWTYDPIGRVTIVRNTKGDNKTIAYDHWKETTIDENGHIKREFKNAFDKITKVEEVNLSAGSGQTTYTTTYEYDSRDLLTKITDNSSNQSTFVYDSLGRKTSQTDPDMGTWTYAYDGVGNVTSQTDNRNITITKTYDELDRVTLVNHPTDVDYTFTYDGNSKIGTLTSVVDKAGTVNYSYDNRLRKTQEQRTINGTTKTTQFAYDAMDRTVTTTYPDGEVVSHAFNNQGEIESATGSASLVTNIDYNALGKITSKAFGNGLSTNYSYNLDDFRLSNITTGSLQNLSYTYDAVGNVKTRVNNLTSKTEMFSYDDLDRLKTASESAGYNHEYSYNAIGNLTSFTSSGSATTYTYGANGKPHAVTSSTASASAAVEVELLSSPWNLTGSAGADEGDLSIASNTLNGATAVKITFDLNGTSFGTGDDEASIVFVQGDWYAINVTDYGTNGMDGSQTITVPISDFRRVNNTEILDPEASVSNLHARFWNSGSFNVDVISIKVVKGGSQGGQTNLALNKSVVASSVEWSEVPAVNAVDGNTSTRWASGYTDSEWIYVDLGSTKDINRVKLNWEAAYGKGYQIQVSDNATNWTTIYSTTTGNGGIDDLTNLSGSGRYVKMNGTERGINAGFSLWEFEVYGPATSSANMTYTYDANGNMTSDGTTCYQINEANQIDKVTKCSTGQTIAEYVYDYMGNRMVKRNFTGGTLANTVTSWSDAYETKVVEGGSTTNASYYFANGQLIAKKDNSGTSTYFHNDHLGSTSLVTNSSGSLVENTTYDPWGEVKLGGTSSKFLYTGQENDSETGLHYYNARYYNPDIRRFTQPDSLVQNIYDPQYLNRYSYARNNPLKYIDPTGHINEILAYNNALTQYYKKPSKATYSNVSAVASSIIQKSASSGSGSSVNNVKESEKGIARDFIQQSLNSNPVSRFVFGEDIKTINSSYSTFAQKGWAFVGLASNLGGPGAKGAVKGLQKAPKVIEGIEDVTKSGNGIRAGEFQFSKNHPGRVDEFHGISLDGTPEGIFRKDVDGNRLYSHTVWKNGEIVYQRDQFEREIINLHE